MSEVLTNLKTVIIDDLNRRTVQGLGRVLENRKITGYQELDPALHIFEQFPFTDVRNMIYLPKGLFFPTVSEDSGWFCMVREALKYPFRAVYSGNKGVTTFLQGYPEQSRAKIPKDYPFLNREAAGKVTYIDTDTGYPRSLEDLVPTMLEKIHKSRKTPVFMQNHNLLASIALASSML